MNTSRTCRLIAAASLLGALAALGGCVAPGYDGYAGVDVGYVGDYWAPCCYDYGGWGGRYHVGPPGRWRGGDHGRPGGGHIGGGGRRGAPSIPGRHR